MQSISPILKQLPEILWFQIFKHLEIHEFVKLRLVSKKVQKYVNGYIAIYERECLRIFTSDLELFGYSNLSLPFLLCSFDRP